MENFNLAKIKGMCAIDAKDYLMKYFVPLSDANHAFYDCGKYLIREGKDIKATYFNRMSKELNEFYFKDYTDIKRVTFQLNQPTFFDDYINLCPQLKAKNNKLFHEHSERAKAGVQMLLNFIKDVLSDNNDESYTYLIHWLSNMMKGNKNDACLYMKGQQGIGKSTLPEFLKNHVIGTELLLETGSEPLKSKFNMILGGKLLVVFEELENFSVNEWTAVSSVLKRFLTSNTYTLESKGSNSFQTNNMNNYILCSNNDAIKDDDGRRYHIMDISHKYKGDHTYFGALRQSCFNDEAGQAFYSYMMEINTDGFIPQSLPCTKSKLNSMAKRLDKVYEFIKENYILKSSEMHVTAKNLYIEYEQFCNRDGTRKQDKHSFSEKLQQIGIEYRKTKGNHFYIYSKEQLLAIANKCKWIHELDMFAEEEAIQTHLDTDYDAIITEKNKEIYLLKAQLARQQIEINALTEKLNTNYIDLVELL